MRICRIKNKYIYWRNRQNAKTYRPDKTHDYAVCFSRESKKWRLVGLTHLLDPKRERQMLGKQVMPMMFAAYKKNGFDIPSGVWNTYIESDIRGRPIDLRRMKAIPLEKGKLSKPQSAKIRAFAKNKAK